MDPISKNYALYALQSPTQKLKPPIVLGKCLVKLVLKNYYIKIEDMCAIFLAAYSCPTGFEVQYSTVCWT
jgi:hypothetical protein